MCPVFLQVERSPPPSTATALRGDPFPPNPPPQALRRGGHDSATPATPPSIPHDGPTPQRLGSPWRVAWRGPPGLTPQVPHHPGYLPPPPRPPRRERRQGGTMSGALPSVGSVGA